MMMRRSSVAAGQAQHHAKGAAQKHKAAEHDEKSQDKAGHGRASSSGEEFPPCQGKKQASQNKPDDFRPYVLDIGGGVESQRPGSVPEEAGNAEAHIHGIAEKHQKGGQDTDEGSGGQDCDFFIFHLG